MLPTRERVELCRELLGNLAGDRGHCRKLYAVSQRAILRSPRCKRFGSRYGAGMDLATADSPILRRTLELCQVIAEQPDFQELKARIDAFMDDELAKFQYQQVNELGQVL